MRLTRESREALSRARFFLEKAKGCASDDRGDFEAYLEAAIVFARAAVHRLQARQPNVDAIAFSRMNPIHREPSFAVYGVHP